MRARLSSILLALAGAAAAQTATPPAPIGPGAVWTPPEGFFAAMHKACDASAGDAFAACFAARMEKAGASAEALQFTRRTDGLAFAREFRDTGIVDVVCAEYPFRANENGACFLVNGEPPMLDVDDPKLIDPELLRWNRVYAGILKAYPDLTIFPGRRSGEMAVIKAPLRNGGLQFRVDYSLRDGCHACARVGTLRMAFDFDVNGRYAGAKVSAVRALNH